MIKEVGPADGSRLTSVISNFDTGARAIGLAYAENSKIDALETAKRDGLDNGGRQSGQQHQGEGRKEQQRHGGCRP